MSGVGVGAALSRYGRFDCVYVLGMSCAVSGEGGFSGRGTVWSSARGAGGFFERVFCVLYRGTSFLTGLYCYKEKYEGRDTECLPLSVKASKIVKEREPSKYLSFCSCRGRVSRLSRASIMCPNRGLFTRDEQEAKISVRPVYFKAV